MNGETDKLKNFFNPRPGATNALAGALALVSLLFVVWIHVAPHYLLWRAASGSGGRIYYAPELLLGEGVYASVSREAYEGKIPASDPYLYENKNRPYVHDQLPPLIVAALGRLTGSYSTGVIAVFVIFPALSFLMLRRLALKMSGAVIGSVAAAFIVLFFANNFVDEPNIKLLFSNPEYSPPLFLRGFIPALTHPFLLFFLLVHFDFFHSNSFTRRAAALLALVVSVNFYIYTYYWTYIAATVGFSFAAKMFLREISLKRDWRSILLFLSLTAAAVVPFALNKYVLMSQYGELSLRVGMFHGDFFFDVFFKRVGWTLIVCVAAFLLRIVDLKSLCYFTVLLFPLLFLENIQVFLGFNVCPWHWEKYVQSTLQGLIMTTILMRAVEKSIVPESPPLALALAALAVVYFGNAALDISRRHTNFMEGTLTEIAQYAPVYRWLNENARPDSVMLASPSSEFVYYWTPVLTSANIFLPAAFTTETIDSHQKRFFITRKLFGIEDVDTERILETQYQRFTMMMYQCTREYRLENANQYPERALRRARMYSLAETAFFPYMPLNHQERLRKGFRAFDLKANFDRFRIDYILCAGEQDEKAAAASLKHLGRKFKRFKVSDEFVLLKIKQG